MAIVTLTGKDNLQRQCPITVNSNHVAEIRTKQSQQPMGASQNPQTVTVPTGTEILYVSGTVSVVAEPHDLVKKLLWPPKPIPEYIPDMESHLKAPEPKEGPRKTAEPKAGTLTDTAEKRPPQGVSNDPGSQAPAAHSS